MELSWQRHLRGHMTFLCIIRAYSRSCAFMYPGTPVILSLDGNANSLFSGDSETHDFSVKTVASLVLGHTLPLSKTKVFPIFTFSFHLSFFFCHTW